MSLFDPQFVERSDEVKLASRKWEQLKQQTSSAMEFLRDFDLELILAKFVPGYPIQKVKTIETQGLKGKETDVRILPPLTGIFQLSDVLGNIRMLAVIDGKVYSEGAVVQGFTIQKITEKGVGMTKAGTSWFVQAPEVYYSLDKRGSAMKRPSRTLAEEGISAVSE